MTGKEGNKDSETGKTVGKCGFAGQKTSGADTEPWFSIGGGCARHGTFGNVCRHL